MTDNYKKDLLNYITELIPGTPSADPTFTGVEQVPRSKWEPFIPSDWSNFRFKGAIKSNTSDKMIFYGGYVEGGGTYSANSKGIIIITDSELNPIKTIYKYSSGTDLRPIECMIQEEDGQFVAVDSTVLHASYVASRQAYYNGQRRFIMLNDISIPINNEYQVNLRTSYNFGSNYNNFICKDMFKNPSSSHYFMAGTRIDTSTSTYSARFTKVIDLKVNVGSSNEWSTSQTATEYIYGGSYCYFDSDDNAQWKLLISPISRGDSTIRYWYGTNGSATNSAVIWTPSYKTYIDEEHLECQSVFINENLVYFTTNNQLWGISGSPNAKYVGLYEYDFSTDTLKEIYLKSLGNYDYSYLDLIQLYAVNGELYIEYCDGVNTTNNTAHYTVQRYEGTWSPITVGMLVNYVMDRRAFYVSQTFNLTKMYCLSINPQTLGFPLIEVTDKYNVANYNGNQYDSYNSLKGRYVDILANDKVVFSRNLHNISTINNYTIASVEIPNTYLNNINLGPSTLIGETDVPFLEDNTIFSKNIYETVYLNYINTINVKDNESVIQTIPGRYINSNINVGTEENYNNSRCSKIRINYADNSVKTFGIGWITQDYTHKYCEFTINVDKEIKNLEFISNDESTTYITIQRELEVGKAYTFKQYLKVE